jgi:GDP-D-mannose dehydratase
VLGEFRSVVTTLKNVPPRYIYNLAAQSSVGLSFDQPVETIDSFMHGTINVLEAMRFLALDARFYVAGCFSYFNLDWRNHVVTTDAFRRPTDILHSSGNPQKARGLVGWSATIRMPRVLELLIEAEQDLRRT